VEIIGTARSFAEGHAVKKVIVGLVAGLALTVVPEAQAVELNKANAQKQAEKSVRARGVSAPLSVICGPLVRSRAGKRIPCQVRFTKADRSSCTTRLNVRWRKNRLYSAQYRTECRPQPTAPFGPCPGAPVVEPDRASARPDTDAPVRPAAGAQDIARPEGATRSSPRSLGPCTRWQTNEWRDYPDVISASCFYAWGGGVVQEDVYYWQPRVGQTHWFTQLVDT
jgi:hypothetical protein